jgi:hypothetical protein
LGLIPDLDPSAVELIYAEQPLHRTPPAADPLVILNKLDNADKHRLLHQAFVYPGFDRGIDLIEVIDRTKVKIADNRWNAGQPLESGTHLAHFMIRGELSRAIRARPDAMIGSPAATSALPGSDTSTSSRACAESPTGPSL